MNIDEIISEFLKDFSLTLHEKDMIFIKNSRYEYIYCNEEYEKFLIDNFLINFKKIRGITDFQIFPLKAAEECRRSDIETTKVGYFVGSELVNDKEYIIVKLKLKKSDIPKNGIITLAKLIQ